MSFHLCPCVCVCVKERDYILYALFKHNISVDAMVVGL